MNECFTEETDRNRGQSIVAPRGSLLAPRGKSSSLLALPACVQRLSTASGRAVTPSAVQSTRSRCMALPPLSEKLIASASCSALKTDHLRCSWCMMMDLVLVLNNIAGATPILQRSAEHGHDSLAMHMRFLRLSFVLTVAGRLMRVLWADVSADVCIASGARHRLKCDVKQIDMVLTRRAARLAAPPPLEVEAFGWKTASLGRRVPRVVPGAARVVAVPPR